MGRVRRRKIKKVIFLFFLLLLLGGFGFFIIFSIRGITYNPFFVLFQSKNTSIINPDAEIGTKDKIEKALNEKNILFTNVKETDDSTGVSVDLKDGPSVIFAKENDASLQVSSLQSILTRLTIDNKKPKKIDFRYSKPIVNF